MIHFDPVPEPPEFDRNARQPGQIWLADHPDASRPRDYWSPFKIQLAEGFHHLCGYSAMYEPVGTVDHYRSVKTHRALAYEWENYRFAAGWINSSKQNAEAVLDPFEVEDDWFEILLPSLQLVVTPAVPAQKRAQAEYTLERLHLQNDERVIRQREAWYRWYQEKKLSIEGLEEVAPLLARAIRKHQHLTTTDAPPE